MKNPILYILLLQLLTASCSKQQQDPVLVSEPATVVLTKFACGPACTAEAWILIMADAVSYEPVDLPKSYKVSNLPVQVTLRRTGLKSGAWQGTGEERDGAGY